MLPRPLPRLACLIALAMALAACDAGPTAAEHLARAEALTALGDRPAAVIELKNAVQKEPENVEARRLLGTAYLQIGDGAGAEKELSRAHRLGSTHPDLPLDLARALLLERKHQEALDLLAKVPGDPPSTRVLSLRGEAYRGLGQAGEARAEWQRAIEADPADASPRVGLASLAVREGHLDAALTELDRALEQAPEDYHALLMKGEILLHQRRFEEAAGYLARALAARGGRDPAAGLALARARLALGDADEAARLVDPIRQGSPADPLANYLAGAIAYQRRDLAAAQEALREVLRVAPDHLPTLLLLGTIHYSQGQLEQAEERLSRYTAAVPGNLASRKLLAAVRLARREPERALQALAPVADPGGQDAQLLALLGTAYLRKGDVARAEEHLERASQLAPDAAAIRTQLALTHLAGGESQQAVTELEAAVDLDAGLVQADVLLVLTHLRERRPEEALAAARRLVERQPEEPLGHNLLGAAELARQDPQAARAAFLKALEVAPGFFPAALNLARLDLREGRVDDARRRYEAVLTREEHQPQALVGLARLRLGAGDRAGGVELLERARRHNPTALEPRLLLAAHSLEARDLPRAEELAREALELGPENAAALGVHAEVALAAGRPADAARSLAALVDRGVQSPSVYARLGAARAAAGEPGAARTAYERALELTEGKHPSALLGLGRLDLADRRPEAARERATQLRSLYPDSALGATLEGDALLALSRPGEAATAYAEALARGEGTDLALKLAGARSAAGDVEGAHAGLREWLERHPEDGAARLALASHYQASGDRARATAEYQALVERHPGNAVALNNLAWLYHEAGDTRALELAERALAAAPDNPSILDTVGWIQVQKGKAEQGVHLLRQAVDRAPEAAEIRYHFGVALARSGDVAGARRELEAALKRPDEGPWRADAKRILDLMP
jgi:putative PEP-CTERM system TPR-repeat lipoprotein